MRGYTSDAKIIVVFNRGLRVRNVSRLVFTGHSFPGLSQDAAGVINYNGNVTVVYKDEEDVLFIDLAEPPVRRGGQPLTRKLILN